MIEDVLRTLVDWIHHSYPLLGLLAPLVAIAFPFLAAIEQAKTKSMRVTWAAVFLLVAAFQGVQYYDDVDHRETEVATNRIVQKLLADDDQGLTWTEEEKAHLTLIFGKDTDRVIERLSFRQARSEDPRALDRRCTEAAQQAAADVLVNAKIDLTEAFCERSLAESRKLMNLTRSGIDSSLANAQSSIVGTAKNIREDWEEAIGRVDNRLHDMTANVDKALESMETLDRSVETLNQDLTSFRLALMAEETPPPKGMLVTLRSDLGNVNSDVGTLNATEKRNKEYRRCLARRIWPFTLKCASLLGHKTHKGTLKEGGQDKEGKDSTLGPVAESQLTLPSTTARPVASSDR